tara:strand:+ start:190 stop:588 length:399 start_codon:yes stop_codon:yes gene_type:complete
MRINTNNKVYDSFRAEVIKEIKEDNKYNGWSNYETWVFKLWIDNDQELYNSIYNYIKNGIKNQWITSITMNHLKDIAEDMTLDFNQNINYSGLASDLIGRALHRINYYEIASVMVQDYKSELSDELNNKEVV